MSSHRDILSPEAQRRFLRYRWIVYAIQTSGNAAVLFLFVVPATIGDQLATLWNLDAASLGLLGSFLFYPYALMQIPSGYFSDTWGPRRTTVVAMLIMAAGQLVFAQATGFEMALAGRALTGLGGSLVLISALKTLVSWFRAREFATLTGGLTVISFGGAMLATAPLAFLAARWGWRLPLTLVGGVTLALAVLNWILVRDDPRQLGLPSVSQIDPASAPMSGDASSRIEDRSLVKVALLTWLRTPGLWMISLVILLSFGSFQAFQFLWAGPYLAHVHHKSQVTAGASLVLLSVGGGFGPLVSAFLSDRVFRARRPFLIAGALGVASAWLWILATTRGASTSVINLTFLLLSFSAGFILIGQPMVKEIVRPEVFGTVFGIVNMFPFIGNALFQVLMGWLLNVSGATVLDGSRIYSPAGYWLAFLPAFAASILGAALSLFVPESLQAGQ